MRTTALFIILFLFNVTVAGESYALTEKFYHNLEIPERYAECVSEWPPSIGDLNRHILKYARLRPRDLSRWKKRIKWAALLPRLQFGYERKVTDGVTVDVEDSVSVASSGVMVGPTASAWDQNLDRNNNIEVNAVWYLDELVFNRDELAISSEIRSHVVIREKMLSQSTIFYTHLKGLTALYLSKKERKIPEAGRVRLEIDRLIGELDARTGGWFGRAYRWKEFRCE